MNESEFENSELAFFQYEARKVIDALIKNKYTEAMTEDEDVKFFKKDTSPKKAYTFLSIEDPQIMMALAKKMRKDNAKADYYIKLLTSNERLLEE